MRTNTVCPYEADYSKVPGDRVLPFIFSLNTEKSVLEPEEGEYQKFCYDVTAVGKDMPLYADLSHFVLGVCRQLGQEDVEEVTVLINGDPQTIVWGENVEFKTEEHPDPPTGCAGLKFDFPLDKVVGFMEVCIVLKTPYEVGPVNVCVYGGGTTAEGLTVCGPSCRGDGGCESVFYQKETVCVPVKVTPFAQAGTAKAVCCGAPTVNMDGQCPGKRTYCFFTVTQNLCIEIPISFGADIETGAALVQCGDVSEEGCSCSEQPEETGSRQNTEESRKRIWR